MKPYSKRSSCPKCGGKSVGVSYTRRSPYFAYVEPWLSDRCVARTCKQCGFSWPEALLDAATDKETP